MKKILISLSLAVLGMIAWLCQRSVAAVDSSQSNMLIAGLGGFRGVLSEIIWFRADVLQNEGRYSEMAQLANLLATLEPHTPEVWVYSAWNLAYNISVMMPDLEDRWRWVESALKLLRDDGLRLNPRSPELHRELAWLFLSKIGGNVDAASPIYMKRWADTVDDAGGDWSRLKMDPSLVSYIDRNYGRQDWRDPKASAIYWAHHGLAFRPVGAVRAELRQVLCQALMLKAVEDARFAPKALQAMREAYAEAPSAMLKDTILRFRAKFGL
ncbi:MAG: hypothetical protein E7046_15155 [Lentisphaerae bacterium]|nr:hypothetical protein [Lentisphaerota bacterium]